MNVLLDTNVLARSAQPGHPQHQTALDAVSALQLRGDRPCLVPQVLYELWVVATRPKSENGLALTPAGADRELARVEAFFPLLPDTAAVFTEWRRLVVNHHVSGRTAHDARFVAAMAVHGITHLLTFNTTHYSRYPGITVLDPAVLPLPGSP
jgi:predicted nucleic acid-binding protein